MTGCQIALLLFFPCGTVRLVVLRKDGYTRRSYRLTEDKEKLSLEKIPVSKFRSAAAAAKTGFRSDPIDDE